ncbi:MAG: hypothetical protein JST84_04490 [Acidobacteria bacterium]|nr:hypothetical protein [Acidobacteriota bacterium]
MFTPNLIGGGSEAQFVPFRGIVAGGLAEQEVQSFGTTRAALQALAAWLAE